MNKFTSMLTAGAKSWKTTALAVLVALTEWGTQLQAILDNDPITSPDWNQAISLTIVAVALLFSRDADKTSEDAGLKGKKKGAAK